MSRYAINLINEPNQSLSCNLTDDDQNVFAVDIKLRTLTNGDVCVNIDIDGEPMRYGVIAHNKMPLLQNNTLGGNIYFEDQYGNSDPDYAGFNDRFLLVYDTEYTLG